MADDHKPNNQNKQQQSGDQQQSRPKKKQKNFDFNSINDAKVEEKKHYDQKSRQFNQQHRPKPQSERSSKPETKNRPAHQEISDHNRADKADRQDKPDETDKVRDNKPDRQPPVKSERAASTKQAVKECFEPSPTRSSAAKTKHSAANDEVCAPPKPDSTPDHDSTTRFTPTLNSSATNLADLEREQKRRNFIVIVAIVILTVIGYFIFRALNNTPSTPTVSAPKESSAASLSGYIIFDGATPTFSESSRILVYYRELGSDTDYLDTGIRLTGIEDTWTFTQAETGKAYEIFATLMDADTIIADSQIVSVVAPVSDVNLIFRLDGSSSGVTTSNTATHNVSGIVTINGYIPAQSILDINVIELQNNAPASNNTYSFPISSFQMGYNLANIDPNLSYQLTASVRNASGVNIGTSTSSLIVTGSNTQANFTINTNVAINTQQQPTTSANRSQLEGSINIRGPLRDNSTLILTGKRSTDGQFQVWQTFGNLSGDTVSWSTNNVATDQSYDLQVILQVNGNNVASSDIRTVNVPRRNANLTINTGYDLVRPKQEQVPTVGSCIRQGDVWAVDITLPRVDNARQYWLQVGRSTSGGSYFDQKISANQDNDTTIRVSNIPTGIKTNVRYSYSTCSTCNNEDSFSGWSGSVSFLCE